MSEQDGDDLPEHLRELKQEFGRIFARQHWTLILETADGFTRRIRWQGSPPRELHLPLPYAPRVSYQRPGELDFMEPAPLLVRVYECVGSDGDRPIARYRERPECGSAMEAFK